MGNREKSRREVLAMLGNAGVAFTASPFFFLSVSTYPLDGRAASVSPGGMAMGVGEGGEQRGEGGEKVSVSGSGSRLRITIAGKPGRFCGVVWAPVDTPERYAPLKKTRGRIGREGRCVLETDTSGIPTGRVFLRVVTSSDADFQTDLRGTKPFEIVLTSAGIERFLGARDRALSPDQKIVACVTAGYQISKN
jgi:hypothetical protein